ncbi:Nitrilotriacetate monooxygenase component A [compost metagenome]
MIAEGLADFAEHVLPLLERRGYFKRELEGETLRDHLGLSYRESRYAAPAPDIERGRAVGA